MCAHFNVELAAVQDLSFYDVLDKVQTLKLEGKHPDPSVACFKVGPLPGPVKLMIPALFKCRRSPCAEMFDCNDYNGSAEKLWYPLFIIHYSYIATVHRIELGNFQ